MIKMGRVGFNKEKLMNSSFDPLSYSEYSGDIDDGGEGGGERLQGDGCGDST